MELPVAAETLLRCSAQRCTQRISPHLPSCGFTAESDPRAVCVDRLLARRVKEPVSGQRTRPSSLGIPPIGTQLPGVGASAAQALVLLRLFPERQPGFGFGTAAEGDKRPTRGCGPPVFLILWAARVPRGREGVPAVRCLQALGQGHQRGQKKGYGAESEHDGEAKMPLSTATGAASSLGYSLSLRLAENSWRSHSEMSFSGSARIPRGKKILCAQGHQPFPKGKSRLGRQWGGVATFSQQRSSPKEIKNVYFQRYSALNIAAPQLCQ